ncbi:MAG: AAA domain-containing protein [Cyclobacteriaceae bacterium]
MEIQLADYFEKIKFLPGNNRSLLLLDLPKNYFLDIKSLDSPESGFGIIKSIIAREETIKLTVKGQTDQSLPEQLNNISRNEQLIFEERGAKDLYVGWPFVRGKLNDGTLVRCPFIFFPFSLAEKDGEWFLEKRKDVNITLNKTFLLRYAYHNQVKLSEDLIEKVLNDFDPDSTLFRSELYAMLRDSDLAIEFNQRNFIDELQPFKQFDQETLEKDEENGILRLYPYATLGIFPQAGAYLISDYDKLLKTRDAKPTKQNGKDKNEQSIDVVRHGDMFTPFLLDGEQELALKNIKVGNSIAVKGPTGTGKSQLITNVISDFMAHGKSVLLVSQKATALDDVFRQLQQLQLHSFIGLVHDFKNERKNIYEQIIKQLDSLNEYKQKNISLDSDELVRTFQSAGETIEEITSQLNEFKEALFDVSECGKTVRELYLMSGKEEETLSLNLVYRNFTFDKVDKLVPALAHYMEHHRKFEAGEHFWTKGPSLSKSEKVESEKFSKILDEIYALDLHIKKESKKFTSNEIDFETALFFLANKEPLEQLADNLKNETTYNFYIHMVDNPPEQDIGWLSQKERNLLQCFKGAGPEISLAPNELGRFQEALEHAIRARKGIFSWIRWKLFSEDKIFITRVLVANELKSNRTGFETLLERIDNRLNFEHQVSELKEVSWLKEFPDSYRKIDIQNWFFYQKLALKSFQLRHTVRTLPNYLTAKNETLDNYTHTIHLLLDLINHIPEYLEKWKDYVSEAQVRYLLLGKADRSKVEKQLQEDLDDILAYHALRDTFNEEELKIIDDLCELELEGKGQVEQLFISSISNAWIDHIEQKYPVLKIASAQGVENYMEELQSALDEKYRITPDLILSKVREKAISATEKEGIEASYQDLLELLNDPKKKWPIRRVINQFEEEIFSLLPCWITTPESASAIFPMKELFDLVIFDESNLCLAERGIPALTRGTNWMIIGDDQQLPMINIYDNETEFGSSETIFKSLKEQLSTITLKHQYNTKNVDLVAFVNSHFYDNQLHFIPEYASMADQGISVIETHGTWTNQGNSAEAEEVVKLIGRLLKNNPLADLGVVVGDGVQRLLIWNLLAGKNMNLPGSFFIKTIESAQGEIRDQIIFTSAYDNWQQFQHLTPGMVNIISTRARRKLHIVTSLNFDAQGMNDGADLLVKLFNYPASDKKNNWVPDTSKLSHYLTDQFPNKEMLSLDLPFADGAIIKKGKYHGVLLTDDRLDHQTIIDAFYHQYILLRENKWSFIQFFSREFWENRAIAFDKLERFIDRET